MASAHLKTHERAAATPASARATFQLIATQDRAWTARSGDVLPSVPHQRGSNYAQLSDPKADDLIDRAAKETNKDKRRQLYHELQRYILTTGTTGAVPVGWVEGFFFRDKKVRGFKPGLTVYDGNTFMKVWLEP